MDSGDLIKWSEVSMLLTGSRNVIRADRSNEKYDMVVSELLMAVQKWIESAKQAVQKNPTPTGSCDETVMGNKGAVVSNKDVEVLSFNEDLQISDEPRGAYVNAADDDSVPELDFSRPVERDSVLLERYGNSEIMSDVDSAWRSIHMLPKTAIPYKKSACFFSSDNLKLWYTKFWIDGKFEFREYGYFEQAKKYVAEMTLKQGK